MSKKLQAETLQAEASVKDKILNGINAYTPLLRENFKSTFVTLQSGKGLSTEDFTTAEKIKLANANKAQKLMLLKTLRLMALMLQSTTKLPTFQLQAATF